MFVFFGIRTTPGLYDPVCVSSLRKEITSEVK